MERNTAGQTDNNFEGGQSSLWSGSGNCDYIVLNQGISVSGIAVSISWPPSVSGSGSSASWQSQPVYDNVAGASFNGLVVGGTAFLVRLAKWRCVCRKPNLSSDNHH